MIADPIKFGPVTSWFDHLTGWLDSSSDEFLFFDHQQHYPANRYIGIADRGRDEPWCVNITERLFYLDTSSNVVTKEEFFSMLESNYPEHYEWFLWNLELL